MNNAKGLDSGVFLKQVVSFDCSNDDGLIDDYLFLSVTLVNQGSSTLRRSECR